VSLFDDDRSPSPAPPDAPLADRMRPRSLDEFVGQRRIVGKGTALRRAIERDDLRSLILWGPPGSGKTTLARIIAQRTGSTFVPFSAVLSGIREVREVMREADRRHARGGGRTLLFVDEIHRFNKAQQDAFLPFVERGTITLIGATTENPSFEVISALLSRSRVYRLERLSAEELGQIVRRALADRERGLGAIEVDLPDELLGTLVAASNGDARRALNLLEFVVGAAPPVEGRPRAITADLLRDALQRQTLYHDRAGEEHFNLISALHKSMRSSDPDATLYWLARLLEAGDDPLYAARRIIRFASEDVGLADPRALELAVAAKEAVHFVGRPEGELALAEAALYCALAPKSDAVYRAWGEALETIRSGVTDPVPMALRNAPTGLMKAEGYGRGYEHAHDREDAVVGMECLPASLRGRRFYRPTRHGFEERIRARLEAWIERRRALDPTD